MLKQTPVIAIIDNSIKHLSLNCLNYFAERTPYRYTYHLPSHYGVETLLQATRIDGMVILGSNSNVSDRLDWHKDLSTFVINKLEQGIPSLGICFGHQLIADALGCTVDFIQNDQKKFSGSREIIFNHDYFNYFRKDEKLTLGYAHQQEIKKIPDDFIPFASSHLCEFEMIFHKQYPFWGVQGHPESDNGFIQRNMTPLPTDQEHHDILQGGDKVLKCFLSQFSLS